MLDNKVIDKVADLLKSVNFNDKCLAELKAKAAKGSAASVEFFENIHRKPGIVANRTSNKPLNDYFDANNFVMYVTTD